MANITNPQNVVEVIEDQLDAKLESAGNKLVIVDFTAKWCGPCQRAAPEFAKVAARFPNVAFLKVDVDVNPESSRKYGIRVMPTFILFRSKMKIDEFQGAGNLTAKLEEWLKDEVGGEPQQDGKPSQTYSDLYSLIDKQSMECLNQSNDHNLEACLTADENYLESDDDEQLIIHVGFLQNVRLHSLMITGPEGFVPKTIKIFVNQINTMDFDTAERGEPRQELVLTKDDVQENVVIPLRFVKFQNVSSVTLFIKDNQGDEETTRIQHLAFIGLPVTTTNMGEFKRVTGKKGESH